MQERVNKHKPIIKKEVIDSGNIGQQSQFTQNSKFSSNSQNKPFIRKPVSNKRQTFASPTYIKNHAVENAQSNSPLNESKTRQSAKLDTHSDRDLSQGQQMPPLSNNMKINIAIKRHISNQQNLIHSHTLLDNSQAIKQAYYGNDVCSLTEIGQNYKVQLIESDNSDRDIYFGEKMKKNTVKENVAFKNLNSISKKTTRTEYFTNNSNNNINDESKSITTSRSLKQKQINFNQLKSTSNNSVEIYIRQLQQSIRKLQKTTYTLNKKCKWMHEQVEMHLEKQNTMTKQNQSLIVDVKEKQKKISQLKKQLQLVKLQLTKVKLQKKQSLVRYKSFKEIQTISSLRQLSTKKDQHLKTDNKKSNLNADDGGYFANTSLSSEKNKKFSFKTYPGVRSPRNRMQDLSKCSSIVGNNQSSQSENYLGQTSILDNKSCLKQQISLERTQMLCKELQNQRDLVKVQLENLRNQFSKINQEHALKLSENTQHYEQILTILTSELDNHKKQLLNMKQRNNTLQADLDRILIAHQQQVEVLNFKIKQLQEEIQNSNNYGFGKKSIDLKQSSKDLKEFEILNPLQYLLEHPDQSVSTDEQLTEHHFEQQNKSLRKYIQQMSQHYKYIKIENRMLLKLKEDLQKCEKQKKQIKQERDMFKKKLLDTLKNSNKNQVKNNNNNKRPMQYQSDEQQEDQSQSEISAVFQLSQSQIICHPESEFVQQ